jgi:hypothetical protein
MRAPPPLHHYRSQAESSKTMATLIMLAILWSGVVTMLMLRARQVRTPVWDGSQQGSAEPPQSSTDGQDGQSWSALDDRQLTRLLTNSAPRTTSE